MQVILEHLQTNFDVGWFSTTSTMLFESTNCVLTIATQCNHRKNGTWVRHISSKQKKKQIS
jgi:hypothetical protein